MEHFYGDSTVKKGWPQFSSSIDQENLGYYTIDILMGKSDASFTEYFFERWDG